MHPDEDAVDLQEDSASDASPGTLSKSNLRRSTTREPVVRCVRFEWTDRRKRKGYKRTGWLVEWRDANGKRFRRNFLMFRRGSPTLS
jgi:hypothetical protein